MGIKISQYPTEAVAYGDDDLIDVSVLISPGVWDTQKTKYSTLKSAILSAYNTVEKNITARAGGGQTSAYAITKKSSRIDTCASDNDSVKLPIAVIGAVYSVNNLGLSILDIYPGLGQNFLSVSVNSPTSIYSGNKSTFVCYENGVWTIE